MTNVTNDFTFYHGSGSVAPGVRDEYLRLESHDLPTLEKKAIRFMPYRRDREDKQETTFPISHNVHSLHAHTEDIENASRLSRVERDVDGFRFSRES